MTNVPITRKHRPSGSLARRILIVVILLMVIPLFLQTLFLYQQEYREKVHDVQEDLKLLASERSHLISEMIRMDLRFLKQFVGTKGPNAECDECSCPPCENKSFSNVKPLYIETIPLPENAADHFVAVSPSRGALLVGLAESGTSALTTSIPFAVIGKDLPRVYPVHIALVKGDQVLWSNGQMCGDKVLVAEDPVSGTEVAIRLSVDEDQIKALHLQAYYFRFAILVFFVGLVGGLLVYLFTRRIARPLRHLSKTMARVSEGGAHVRYSPDWMGFEINALGLQFNETLDGLLLHMQAAEREKIHREQLAKELHIGHEIQASLLPKRLIGFPGLDIGSGYFAAKEVNGDFYDLFPLSKDKLLIVMCDTAGKGIPACLFALSLRSLIRASAANVELSDLIQRVNDLYFLDTHESSMFATVWAGIYDAKEQKLTYCSQGHPPALLVRGAQVENLWTQGIALGAQKIDAVLTQEINLQIGDQLILYTDGIIEAHNPKNELFGKDRLYDLVTRKQKINASQMADRIIEEVKLFADSALQHDDMTLLVLHIKNFI